MKQVLILGLLWLLLAGQAITAERIETLEIGERAPEFSLRGVDDKKYRLEDFSEAKLLVVIFTCNHCPTAQAYEERIKQLVVDYKEKGVAIVAISPNDPKAVRLNELGYTDLSDTFEEGKIRARDHKFNFPYLYDGDTQKVSIAYGPVATPHVFVFDKERKLRYRGGIDDSEQIKRVKKHHLRNALDALLSGKQVPENDTRVFGCSIKWSDKRDSVTSWMKSIAKEEVKIERIGPEGVKELLKNGSDKARLIYVWTIKSERCRSDFAEFVTMNRMYRGRAFELLTISLDDPADEEKVLSFLKERQASNRNALFTPLDNSLLVKASNDEWKEELPLTLLILPGGKTAYSRVGEVDPLETKRAVVDFLGRIY
jgi:peroxiredoxin